MCDVLEICMRLVNRTHGRDGYSGEHHLLLIFPFELEFAIKINLGACWSFGWCSFFHSLASEINTPIELAAQMLLA
jgi:hypothetical protein